MMKIIYGTNFWRMLSIILMFIIFLGLYYFFIVYPKNTEKARMEIAEEILSSFYWLDLSSKRDIYQAIFLKGIVLDPVYDEMYIKDLNMLRVFYQQNEEKTLSEILNRYARESISDMDSLEGLCLQLKFVQFYHHKIQQGNYSSEKLKLMKDINQQNYNEILPWLNNMGDFDQFYEDKHMIIKCKI